MLLAAASGKYGWDVSLISSSAVLALGRTFSRFGSRCVDCPLFSALILFSSASNIRLSASNVSVKSKLQHAPPPGIPRAFDTFAVPGRREFDYQSLPGGGEFDPYALGVGNLNCTLDVM